MFYRPRAPFDACQSHAKNWCSSLDHPSPLLSTLASFFHSKLFQSKLTPPFLSKDVRLAEAQACYLRAITVLPSNPLAWQGLAELINTLIVRNASVANASPSSTQASKSGLSRATTSTASTASSSAPSPASGLNPLSFNHALFESFSGALTRPVDDTVRTRHVQLNSALFLAYYMLHHVTTNAPFPPKADEAKAKVDRANKLFNLKMRQIASLEEAQLLGLAYSVSKQLLQSHASSGATVDSEDAQVRHSRLLERLLRHSVSARSILDSAASAAPAVPPPAKPAKVKTPEQILAQLAPHMALLTTENLGAVMDGLGRCMTSTFVELPPAPVVPVAKATSSAAAPAAKATTPAKATSSAKQTGAKGAAAKATTPAPAPAPVAKPTAAAPPSPYDSYTHVVLKEKDITAYLAIIEPAPTDATSSAPPEQVLAELVGATSHASNLATPQTRLYLQSLVWSSHASSAANVRDLTTVLELCLRLTGVWGSSLQKLEQCKVSSPTSMVLQNLTGFKANAENSDLRQLFAFGSSRCCSWAVSGPVPFAPSSSGFHLHPSSSNSLTQLPMSPQLVISGKDSETLFALQSSHPTDFASRLPWSTVLRYHVRGYGYDGLNMFEENASNPKFDIKAVAPKVEAKRAASLLHPLVIMSRASVADIEAFNARSDECQGNMFFESSMPRGSSLYRFMFSTFQKYPSDSLAYLLYLEARFDSWMTVNAAEESSIVERDILLQKIASLASQASMQLSHLVARLNAVSKTGSDSQAPIFLRSMIHDSLDLLVLATYLKASALVRQGEYRSALTTCADMLKKLVSVQNTIDATTSTVLYPFYSLQFHLIMAKSYVRLRQFDQARAEYQIVLEAEPWNFAALLGLSSLYASDTTYQSEAQAQSVSPTPIYFNVVISIGYLDMILSQHPNHVWTLARKAYLQALPYIHLAELKNRASILSIMDKPRTTAVAQRQGMWLGTLIQGIGEGIATRADTGDASEDAKRSEADGPIVKAGKKPSNKANEGRKGPKIAVEDDELFETSMHDLASNLLLQKSGKKLTNPETGKFILSGEEEHELMRIGIRSRDALKAALERQPHWHWIQYYLGIVELALGNDVDAKEAFNSAKDENAYAKAFSAHLLAKSYIQHGTDLDLEGAIESFSSAMAGFGEFKRSEKWIFGTGRGDSALLLEAAIPLSHIWLEQCVGEPEVADPSSTGPSSYEKAMSLLQTISVAGHKWASFKAATYQMRRGELDPALASILGFLRFFPRHPDASILLIEIYRRQGKMAAALKSCQKLLSSELVPSESGVSPIHPATLFFISTLLHFKANLTSTAISHARQCLAHIKSSTTSNAQTFPNLEICASFLLTGMLHSESIRLAREGRLSDARLALSSAHTLVTRTVALSSESKTSPVSTFSIQKLVADVSAARLMLLDGTTASEDDISSVSLAAVKAYSYALQDAKDDATNALIRRDLSTVHFSKAQLLLNALSLKKSFNAEASAKTLGSALQALDMAVDELRKSVLLLSPDAKSNLRALSSQARALLLTSWRTLSSVSAFYLRTLVGAKADTRVAETLKIPTLNLKHAPSAKSVNHLYTQAISILVEAPRAPVDEAEADNKTTVSELLVTTAAENKESGRLWAEAGLFWMWTQAPLEIVLEALSKAKRFDPSLVDSWVLHALVLLADEKSLHTQSTAASFGYRTQSKHTVMAGLLWALEEEEANATSTHATPLELYGASFEENAQKLEATDEMQAASGSSGNRESPSKALPIRILLAFALSELSVLPRQVAAGDASSLERSSTLEPEVFARRVFALSSRFAFAQPHDLEVARLNALLASSIGLSHQHALPSESTGFSLPMPFKSLLEKKSSTWVPHAGSAKDAKDVSQLVAAYPLVPVNHALSAHSKESWSLAFTSASQVLSSAPGALNSAVAKFSEAIAAVGVNASKSLSGTDYLAIISHIKTLLNLVVSVSSTVARSKTSDKNANNSLSTTLSGLLDTLAGGLLSLQDLVSAGATETSALLVKQVELLFSYSHWISTYWRARVSWSLGELSTSADAKPIADLTQLLKDIASHEATSEEKVILIKPADLSKADAPKPAETRSTRRVVCRPALHGSAHILVATTCPALPSFADFVSDVVGELLRMLVIVGNAESAVALWHGLLPFNMKSTQPILIELLDASPRDLLFQRYPVEASSLEATLWARFGDEMIATEHALTIAHSRAVLAAKLAWIQQNMSKEMREEAAAAAVSPQSASPSSSSTATPARAGSPAPEENLLSPQEIAATKASAFAQRALLLQPWDDRKWKTLASVVSLSRPSQ